MTKLNSEKSENPLESDLFIKQTLVMTSRYDVISKPDIVTCREIIEWAVARPSRVIKIKRAFGKSSMRYFVDFNVNGSFYKLKKWINF